MEVRVLDQKQNPLLERVELLFEVAHPGTATPHRSEVQGELAKQLKVGKERLIIERMHARFGIAQSRGEALVYASVAARDRISREHILIRHGYKEKAGPAPPSPAAPAGEAAAPAAPKPEVAAKPETAPPTATPEAKPEPKAEPKPEKHAEPKSEKRSEPKPEKKSEPKTDAPSEAKAEGKAEKKEKAEPKAEGKAHGKTAKKET